MVKSLNKVVACDNELFHTRKEKTPEIETIRSCLIKGIMIMMEIFENRDLVDDVMQISLFCSHYAILLHSLRIYDV